MKKLAVACLAVVGLAVAAVPVDAHGLLRRGRCADNGAAHVVVSDCAPAVHAAPAVSYVEQEVTALRAETRTRTVMQKVKRMVTREVEQPYQYTEMVSETVPEEREVTYYESVTREVPYKYNVLVPVVRPEERTVTSYRTVTEQVPYTYNVMVPEVTPQKRMVTTYRCVPEQVVSHVPVCRTVAVQEVDPCTGCCRTVCHKVTEMQAVTRTVMRSMPETHEVTVNVCTYRSEERKGMRTVCRVEPVESKVTVNVCRYESQEREGKRLVCDTEKKTKKVTVNVVRTKPVERKGTHKVLKCEWVEDEVPVTQTYCEMVPYKTTVRMPVYATTSAACPPVPCH